MRALPGTYTHRSVFLSVGNVLDSTGLGETVRNEEFLLKGGIY